MVIAAILTTAVIGGAAWWNRGVTADPQLHFHGAANVFRSRAGDVTGIREIRNVFGSEVQVAFVPGDRSFAYLDLYNGGNRDVRIEAVPPRGFNYFVLDRVLLSANLHSPFDEEYGPFHPFRLHKGETRYLQLHFRMADCNPGLLQDGSTVLHSLPVTYKVLGFRRTVEVPFESIALAIQTIGQCDHPILDHT